MVADVSPSLSFHGFGSSVISSMEGSEISSRKEVVRKETMLNLKETELRLGLPGSVSPERTELFRMGPFKSSTAGAKRAFLDSVDLGCDLSISTNPSLQFNSPRANCVGKSSSAKDCGQPCVTNMSVREVTDRERHHPSKAPTDDSLVAPVAKAQVVGWPPIRSYMKNTMATNPRKSNSAANTKVTCQGLYVKVSMDGAPYLRKIDLRNYSTYHELTTALEKMFSCFTLGQCGSHSGLERNQLSENTLPDLLHGAEYVLTYEDKDGDWMLVGDVPWE